MVRQRAIIGRRRAIVQPRLQLRFAGLAGAAQHQRATEQALAGRDAAKRAMDEAGVHDIALVGIAKRLEELWLPDDDFPVIMPRNSEALFLIQRIRDEAHRFAITHQRTRRKRDVRSQLSEIPGLGPTRVNALLKHFGSVARLREATAEQIAEVNGVGPATAAAVVTKLAQTPTSTPTGSAPDAPTSVPTRPDTDTDTSADTSTDTDTDTSTDRDTDTSTDTDRRTDAASVPADRPVRVPDVTDDGPELPR